MPFFYLHGFASSPTSSKAAFFRQKLKGLGHTLVCPDFNLPDFESLTISRMIDQTGELLDASSDGPRVLIGSSLGAFVALQAAARWPERIERLVLLAPAVDLRPERLAELGNRTIEDWRATGTLDIFHYTYGRMAKLGFALYRDAEQYDAMDLVVPQPIQVFQGLRDAVVNPETVERWSAARPNVELHMLDDDHQMHASLDVIWERMQPFLLL
jgi:pimeloyl-ACP methyl ester carboxylesterase